MLIIVRSVAILIICIFNTEVRAQPIEQKRLAAVTFEWVVAHCEVEAVPAMTFIVMSMVLNGTAPADLDPYRQQIREGVAANYTSEALACADLLRRFLQAT